MRALDKAQATRLAQAGHDGLARSINPVHTPLDGDTLFALATGRAAAHPGMLVLCALAAEAVARATVRVVISWNQPMLKAGDAYVFAASGQKAHVLLAPWSSAVLDAFRPRLEADGYTVNKKTFRVPAAWQVDDDLLRHMVAAVLDDLDGG